MMIMSKEEVQHFSLVFPANGKLPFDRDEQIKLMLAAKNRHYNPISKILENEREGK
jgi:hypothetical protein